MDNKFMLRAIELAYNGVGSVSPNPLVGAVIVKNNAVIAEGYHKEYGGKHAEIEALEGCDVDPSGAELYCNLEPCSKIYSGKINPPCCDEIIKAGISKVIIAQIDPNPQVAGSGVARLRTAGIEVITGVELEKALELNRGFNTVMTKGRPWVHLKWAQSLDGKIAAPGGVSKWISSEACRKQTHELRSKCDGIMVGRRTVELDDPMLDARYGFSPSPRPVVIDSKLLSSPESKIFSRNPIVFTSKSTIAEDRERFTGEFDLLDGDRFDLKDVLSRLKDRGVNSLFVEGGSSLITQFLKAELWDMVTIYTAPKIIGDGLSPVADLGVKSPAEALTFAHSTVEILDGHSVFNGYREAG